MDEFYPPAAFFFKVSIDSLSEDTAFQEVGGLGLELVTEDYVEGGENRFVHTLPKGVKHPKLSLKRGMASPDSALVAWCKDVLERGLQARITTRDLRVDLLDENGNALHYWKITNAFPTNWSVDPFQADKSALAIEKIELNYATSQRGGGG